MNRPQRSIEIFTMSALDLFVTAMGSFAILMMILFPYYRGPVKTKPTPPQKEQRETTTSDDAETLVDVKGDVLFGAWPVRVQDYERFVEETGYTGDYETGTLAPENLMPGDAWRRPGFPQERDHPVVGVSWVDARAFCKWLTEKERADGTIGPLDEYRLPTHDEWNVAVGPAKYPWGDAWPLPEKSGNFSGVEFAVPLGYAAAGDGTYTDDFVFTSPVTAFPANRYGIHDLGGNVQQWCLDFFRNEMNAPDVRQAISYLQSDMPEKTVRVLRGASWNLGFEPKLRAAFADYASQGLRFDFIGFRCVLVVRSHSAP
jgi:formylglycine-generating enzyme required for sulfatase activity